MTDYPTHAISDPARFMELVNAFRISRIILSAAELKIFDHLCGNGQSSEEVAAHLGTKPRATDRLLNALVSCGLLQKSNGVFTNTGFSEKYLVTGSPAYLSGLALTNHTWKTWSTLTDAVFSGTSLLFEKPINERPGEWQEAFIAAMHRRGIAQAIEVAGVLDLREATRMLDVGGGSGAFTLEFLRRNPLMTGVIFDLPNIVKLTEKYLAAPEPYPQEGESLQGRISVLAGDYLKDDFGSGYDLVLMSAIIHINSPEENQLLIRKGADALLPGGRLVILDHVMNEDRTAPAEGAIFAINMLVGTRHGDTYTGHEIRGWMQGAGLRDISYLITPSGVQLLTGRR
jgi:SAM-dependent methyltransferase